MAKTGYFHLFYFQRYQVFSANVKVFKKLQNHATQAKYVADNSKMS